MFFTAVLLFGVFILSLSYVIGSYNESYWKKRGVKYVGGTNMLAMFWDFLFKSCSLYDYFLNVYNDNPNEPVVAVAAMLEPTLFIKNPDDIHYVLLKKFNSFYHNGIHMTEKDKLADSVLFMNGNRWKLTRQKMTPLFSSSKLKKMHYIMDKSAKDFVKYLTDNVNDKKMWDKVVLFTTAALTGSIFGVKSNESTFDAPFLDIARCAISPSFRFNYFFLISNLFPRLFLMSGFKLFGPHEKRFIGAFKNILRDRENEKEDFKRHDFPEMALQLQKNGKLTDLNTGYELEPTDELMAAQAFFFLLAGSQPSAMGMFAVLFELARHPEILKTLQDEIDKAIEDNKNEIDFDVIAKIKYLDQVFDEALRMHPPLATLTRKCTENTTLPFSNVKVDKGTQIVMPIYALHHDPKYYPNPEVFDPERFSPEEKGKRPNMIYMPFSEGNRMCIGQRFAYLQIKTGLVHILRHFTLKLDDINKPMKYAKDTLFLRPSRDVDFKFVPRK